MFAKPKPAQDSPLTVAVSQPSPCQQKLQIRLTSVGIQPVREDVLREFQKEATLAGFRRGKAPRELIEQKFSEEIRQETVRRLTRQVFEQVTQEHKLKPVGPFEVIKLDFDEQKELALEAQVEVEPEFQLAGYRGLPLKKPVASVGAQELEQALAQLRESMAQLVPASGASPATELGEAERRSPESEARGTGEDPHPQKVKQLPDLDDEFAKDAGFETLEQLKGHLESKLREQKQQRQEQECEQQLCEELLGRHRLEVPPRLVAKQTERLSRDFQARLLLAGRAEDQVKEELAKYTEQLRTNAVRLVKLAFILDRIAEQEQLSITQDEVVDRLWKLAKRWGKDPVEVRRLLDAQGLWASVLSSIRQDKTMRLLMDAAHVEEVMSDK